MANIMFQIYICLWYAKMEISIIIIIISAITGFDPRDAVQMSSWPVPSTYLERRWGIN